MESSSACQLLCVMVFIVRTQVRANQDPTTSNIQDQFHEPPRLGPRQREPVLRDRLDFVVEDVSIPVDRLARDLGLRIVGPLDGLRAAQLHGAHVVVVVGA